MGKLLLRFCLFSIAICSFAAAAQQTIPANTPIEIRLTQRISTQRSKAGQPVEAILAAPVLIGDQTVLPLGSKVTGTIQDLDSVKLGFYHETASVALKLDHITLPDGTAVPFTARVAQIENSREVIDKHGRIRGVRSTGTLSHKASGAVGFFSFSNPIALIFTTASSAAVLRFSDPEITLPADTELILLTTEPITVNYRAESSLPPLTDSPASQQALRALIHKQPYRTVTDPKHVPSDVTNLMFIGDANGILRAFLAAGWLQVDSLDAQSTYRTIRSISEQQSYRTAPMSTLLLEGQKPTYALAKTLDTFSKRHHLRIFATQSKWEGEAVWNSSSTQDIGIGFSASQKNFIHQIDHNIDHERTKVVNDLMLTGCVTGLNLVQRAWLPKDMKNGTDEPIVTDGRIAVIRINECTSPLNVADITQTDELPIHPNPAAKATRQTVLTLRNTLIRDNIAVTAYGGIKTGLGMKHPKPPEQPLETSSEINTARYAIGQPNEVEPEPTLHRHDDDPGKGTIAEAATVKSPRFAPPSIELGVHGGWAGYAGGNGGAIGYYLVPDDPTDPFFVLAMGNEHHNGWNLGGSVTINSYKYFSHEFVFDYNRTGFMLEFVSLGIGGSDDSTDPQTSSSFEFQEANLSTTEFAYNAVFHMRPRGSRFRPYVSVGPSIRLMHLTDAPIKKASPWFKLGLSTVGSIFSAYETGSTPPLDGGGIFQPGLQYAAGVKYRIKPRWILRAEYKETLTSQPDFWSKSSDEIYNTLALPGYTLGVLDPDKDSAMRQQRATVGVSFVF